MSFASTFSRYQAMLGSVCLSSSAWRFCQAELGWQALPSRIW